MNVRRGGFFLELQTPAKLNFFLEVLDRRPDGYHEIETLMTAVTIYDSLFFAANQEGRIELSCEWATGLAARTTRKRAAGDAVVFDDLPLGDANLVVRALERLRTRTGVQPGATVRLIKRIPVAAGLGGASSDAAAALVAANDVWRLGWSPAQLAEFAAELGSDIPFFLGGGAAVCRGRGEKMESVAGLPRFDVVVVRPPAGLSTPDVYRRCQPATEPVRLEPLLRAARGGNIAEFGRLLHNRLQPAAEQLSPWIERLRREFGRLDFLGHQMSGSGSSYFGICRNARHARRLAGQLRQADLGIVYSAATIPSI